MIENGDWLLALSVDTNTWNACESFSTKKEALAEGRKLFKQAEESGERLSDEFIDMFGCEYADIIDEGSFAVGQANKWKRPKVNAHFILEAFKEQAWDEVGDFSDGYLYATEKQISELGKKLEEAFSIWEAAYHQEPSFYTIENVEEIPIAKPVQDI